MENLIKDCIKTKEIHVNSRDIRSTIGNAIESKLKKDMEGLCCEDGYIIKDSIKIIERSIGKVISINNDSKIKYNIKYSCSIITPSNGMKIDCYINSVSKMGAVAFIKYNNLSTFKESPLLIIIPKNYFEDIDSIEINKKYKVEILATRLKYKSEQIHIVAKLV